jgi:membrane protein CcdC involved in cytochrome C biogenesis
MKQTKLESWIEATMNIVSGFLISMLMWMFVVEPAIRVGWLEMTDAFEITMIFTVTSLLRSFFWRRYFNAGQHKVAANLARKVVNACK